jgi:hypothetical protein
MTEQDIQQIKLIIQAEAENLACMFGGGAGNVRYYMNKKPNWLVRNCAKIFFDFTWKSV